MWKSEGLRVTKKHLVVGMCVGQGQTVRYKEVGVPWRDLAMSRPVLDALDREARRIILEVWSETPIDDVPLF